MSIDSIQKCADYIAPSGNDVICLHEIEWDNCQKDTGIAWNSRQMTSLMNIEQGERWNIDWYNWNGSDDAVVKIQMK